MVHSSAPATPDEVALHYDQLDGFYREVWGEHMHHGLWRTGRESAAQATRALVEVVAARLQATPGMTLCDVGCGYGAAARMLTMEWQAKVTGITLSAAQFRHAQSQGGGPVYRLGDWLCNDLPDASFDGLYAIESTEHMQEKPRVFGEMARVLRPGGRLVWCTWLAGPACLPWQQRLLLEPVCREARLPALGTEAESLGWLQQAGLEVLRVEDVSRQARQTWPAYAGRFLRAVLLRPSLLGRVWVAGGRNAVFALTMLRIWLAYRLDAMRYIIYTAQRPQG